MTTPEPEPLQVDPLDLAWLLVIAYRAGRADEAADAAARWRATVTPALAAAERHSRTAAARWAAYASPALTPEQIRTKAAESWARIEVEIQQHERSRRPA